MKKFYKVFDPWLGKGLSQPEAELALKHLLELPWIKKLQVFSSQAVFIIDLNTLKYLYVSPAARSLMGYGPEDFVDVAFAMGIMDDLARVTAVNAAILAKIGELNLSREDLLRMRVTRCNWYIHRENGPIKILENMMVVGLSPQNIPAIQMTIASDITSFGRGRENAFSITLAGDDGNERLLHLEGEEIGAPRITDREKEVLQLLSLGSPSRTIADRLGISKETVDTHRKNLMSKAGASNTLELVRFAFASGWV